MIRKSCQVLGILAVCAALPAIARPGTPTECLQSARLKASDPDPFDSFGRAVSIWGDTVVVGAFWDDQNGLDAGAVYVFAHTGAEWAQQQKLLPSDGQANDNLGRVVAVDCETILVSANGGRVYVYESADSVWTETQVLIPSDGDADGGGFGSFLKDQSNFFFVEFS